MTFTPGDEQPLDTEQDLKDRASKAVPMQMMQLVGEDGSTETHPVVMHGSWDDIPQELKDADLQEEREKQAVVDAALAAGYPALAKLIWEKNELDEAKYAPNMVFLVEEREHGKEGELVSNCVHYVASTLEKALAWAHANRDDQWLSHEGCSWLIIGNSVDSDIVDDDGDILMGYWIRKNGRVTIAPPNCGYDYEFLNEPLT